MRLLSIFICICLIICGFSPQTFAKKKSRVKTTKHKTHSVYHFTKKTSPATLALTPIAAPSFSSARRGKAIIYGTQQLTNEINRILQPLRYNVNIGIYVKSMRQNDYLFAKNVYQQFVPASILKIFTAEAALLYLGPEYRFSTQLLTDAKSINNGVLQGNLYIIQTGDPSLTYYDLTDLMVSLKAQQIHAISGNVYIDNSAYDQATRGPGWLWDDKKYCYAAPISASIINHNCISLQVAPAKTKGAPAQIRTSPRYYYPRLINRTTTASARPCALHVGTETNSAISLNGCMPKGQYAWGISYVLEDIEGYNLSLFRDLLRQMSIQVYGRIQPGIAPSHLSVVATHQSKPLKLLITEMLKKSDNIIAGSLFKKMGQISTSRPGSWENGSRAVIQILTRRCSMDPYGARVIDGSGLSRDNRLSPSQMMQVLDFSYHHYPSNDDFLTALPISGVDGTLKHRMSNIARKVRAKTGSMKGVLALAGYAISADKEPLAFVIMINTKAISMWQYKQIEDKIVTALTRYSRV
ncbi:MAG: D-alanyl-D-alanine carboxypeptidase/D-alanyl-D-alanine-endopeptidase [Gammaproteobacteria bacterium RIFCSPHIGHO2_12_FULL_41_20]|nr:MAG: D-alanyl-D-alanine carboxypeptidase/D-alanyl-D-alanine-endopeptidase [Gammaproteobacteria bacterium RIFCSPHIGHO2_12_FULL_41_20]